MDDYNKEHHQTLVRNKLNADKIKLWLPPYTTETGGKGLVPQELITRYAKDLSFPEIEVEEILETLRLHALQKLAERNKFENAGIATLKIKLAGQVEGARKKVFSVEISLDKMGSDLRAVISENCGKPCEQIKLISSGRVIHDSSLKDQGIRNGAQIMVIQLAHSEVEAQRQEDEMLDVVKTRKAAELLSSRIDTDDDDFEVQIADQSGRPLQLPVEERKALTLAMTLHEKGRAALKRREITRALLLLLEADKEFSKCRVDLLKAVDNYAVLCLDIVWCYLCLKNISELPDAERRLRTSEDCFIQSYGANNERLTAVKGGTGSEQAQALFMRLHLLQGIVAFHQHRINDAVQLLNKAETEFKNLQVDEDKITQVLFMGFSEREARLGLRACRNNVQQAVEHIMNKRKEKAEIKKKSDEERESKRLSRKLGKTANGQWVNVSHYNALINMGFSKKAASASLKQTNNDINQAIEVLQNHPEYLDMSDNTHEVIPLTDDMIAQLTSMGFDFEMAREALSRLNGNIQKAAEMLLKHGGLLPLSSPEWSSESDGSSSPSKSDENSKMEKDAIENLMSDLSRDEEDYLDLALQEEAQFLSEYKTLLASISDVR
ncbi:NEDD8 ultimate buster 1-like [Gigantopelta aegis]|uniref:NEDD8 ultimate buster 1-like n=1 Tax=Gigantopelta aegis TaxID=1735272 RepID=UPI001B88A6E8|nr:NEDD8 ultimate buster 1-like [Gigantopelta aegis]XP_041374981.1 NEDD8 ultimate buster 1-like [Gigantopelta aegis]